MGSSVSTLSRNTDSLTSISCRSSLADNVFSKSGRDIESVKLNQSGIADSVVKVSPTIVTESKSEPVSNATVESTKQQTPKQKISFSEYTKMRKKQLSIDESHKPATKTMPTEDKVIEDAVAVETQADKANIEQKTSN